jgi:hypothetical protein
VCPYSSWLKEGSALFLFSLTSQYLEHLQELCKAQLQTCHTDYQNLTPLQHLQRAHPAHSIHSAYALAAG